jgi:hypothetical protein
VVTPKCSGPCPDRDLPASWPGPRPMPASANSSAVLALFGYQVPRALVGWVPGGGAQVGDQRGLALAASAPRRVAAERGVADAGGS